MDESTSTLMPETTRIWLDAETSRHWYKNFTVASMLSSHNDGADQQRQMEPSLFTDNNAYWSALFVGGQGPNNQSPTQFNASEWKELCDNLPALETSEEDVKKHMGELITNINSNSYPAIKRFLDRELREEVRPSCIGIPFIK